MSFLEKLTVPIANIKNKNMNDAKKSENIKAEDWTTGDAEGQLSIDVFQTPSDIVIKSTIAGVKPDDLDIAITNDMVTIRGRRDSEHEIKKDDYFYQECYWGPFSRSIILPVDVQTEKSVATLKNGVLTVRLPKSERIRTKKIEIEHHEE